MTNIVVLIKQVPDTWSERKLSDGDFTLLQLNRFPDVDVKLLTSSAGCRRIHGSAPIQFIQFRACGIELGFPLLFLFARCFYPLVALVLDVGTY